MRTSLSVFFTGLYLFLLTSSAGYAQTNSVQQLEQQVYNLNNQLKYNESQALLLPLLQDDSLSADYKYQAAILLSYTYKRLLDYAATLKFLRIARKFAQQTSKQANYEAAIGAEEAFVLFDTHEYKKADSLMSLLEESDFQYINLENKSKLVMQQGYLLFLRKQYSQAEALYDKAIRLMRASTPCHLPMIYVKKMQLYQAINRLDQMQDALRQSTIYADSCHIIKYHLYAYEELLRIYQSRNDLLRVAITEKKLDSLTKLYAREQNIASLHEQKESILLNEKDKQIRQEHTSKNYLTLILTGMALMTLVLLGWLLNFQRQKRRAEREMSQMKTELATYLSQFKGITSGKQDTNAFSEEVQKELSKRQQEVLEYMATGMSNKEIASALFISENTVKFHIKNIYQLLAIKDRKNFLANLKK